MNGFRFIYGAKLLPIGKPVDLRIKGEGRKRLRVDEYAFALARKRPENVAVLVEHDETEAAGRFLTVLPLDGWWHGEFVLDPDTITEPTEARIRPGLNVSIGFDVIRSETDLVSGVETVLEGIMKEVSLTRGGMCAGAVIVHKWPAPRAARSSTAGERASTRRPAVGDEIIVHQAGSRLVRPGLGQVLAVHDRAHTIMFER